LSVLYNLKRYIKLLISLFILAVFFNTLLYFVEWKYKEIAILPVHVARQDNSELRFIIHNINGHNIVVFTDALEAVKVSEKYDSRGISFPRNKFKYEAISLSNKD
jgi:hypothetical protein